MSPILVCLFVFSVGSVSSKIQEPKVVDRSEALDSNAESLVKRRPARSIAQDDASTITKRNVGKHNSEPWLKLNFLPVCFGARGNQYGSFSVPYGGKIASVKLVHLSGYVSCVNSDITNWSFWGCGNRANVKELVNVVITASNNNVVVPPSQFFALGPGKWSKIPGYNSLSPEIVLPSFSPYSVSSGQQLRLWYGEDLVAYTESDNGGRVCCDVYALYVEEVLRARFQLQSSGRLSKFVLSLAVFIAAVIKG